MTRHADRTAELRRYLRPPYRAGRGSRITVHGARKTCGSLLAALDIHPRVAMQIPRHSKCAITMKIYTELPLGCQPRRTEEARAAVRPVNTARCCTLLLHKIKTTGFVFKFSPELGMRGLGGGSPTG
jgi:integrase